MVLRVIMRHSIIITIHPVVSLLLRRSMRWKARHYCTGNFINHTSNWFFVSVANSRRKTPITKRQENSCSTPPGICAEPCYPLVAIMFCLQLQLDISLKAQGWVLKRQRLSGARSDITGLSRGRTKEKLIDRWIIYHRSEVSLIEEENEVVVNKNAKRSFLSGAQLQINAFTTKHSASTTTFILLSANIRRNQSPERLTERRDGQIDRGHPVGQFCNKSHRRISSLGDGDKTNWTMEWDMKNVLRRNLLKSIRKLPPKLSECSSFPWLKISHSWWIQN